jgi:ATP-dependent Lon protease
LQGNVTAIGGLDLKIMGGINGGVTTFIFPKDNIKDFNDFMDKNGAKDEVKSIVFIPVCINRISSTGRIKRHDETMVTQRRSRCEVWYQ